ncbi:hypothetical protein [Aquisediminimonas profunda]|uniref:hypothetical protein n=1 Tax=Aquisediminimonas profunda TaxID=1550733 RepID=UPI001C6392B7|nr:hypothetical protein [Aquisediminimonas profunda]
MSQPLRKSFDDMTPEERAFHSYDLIGWIVTGIMKEGNCERNEKVEELIHHLDKALQRALRLHRVVH